MPIEILWYVVLVTTPIALVCFMFWPLGRNSFSRRDGHVAPPRPHYLAHHH